MLTLSFLCQEYKKDLEDDIRSDTGGDFRAALLALCKVRVCPHLLFCVLLAVLVTGF